MFCEMQLLKRVRKTSYWRFLSPRKSRILSMNRTKYLIKNIGLLTISNFSSKILVFLLVPLYTSVLTTSEYGTYDLIISTVSLIYPIFTLNIADAVMRFTMDDRYSKGAIISKGLKYICLGVAITAVVTYGLSIAKIWDGLLPFFGFYYTAFSFNQFLTQMAKGLEKVQDMAISGVISTLIMVLGNIIFLLIFQWGLNGFFLAGILSQALSALYLCFRMRAWQYIKHRSSDKNLNREMLFYSIPLIATSLGWWVNNTLDRYAVVFLCGVAANGLLSVAYKIPSILNVVQQIFIQAWQISAIREYGENESRYFYGKAFSTINMMMCMVCAVLILLTRPLASILYAREFYSAWVYVPFLLISSALNCAAGLLGPVLSAKRDSKTMMWSAIVGAFVNAVLNIILILFMGVQGAAVATMISSLAIFIIRRYGVGKDILIVDRYWLTWLILIAQACAEVSIGTYILELALIGMMIALNAANIKSVIRMGTQILRR